jgi:hypothetical protein
MADHVAQIVVNSERFKQALGMLQSVNIGGVTGGVEFDLEKMAEMIEGLKRPNTREEIIKMMREDR